MKIFVFHKNRHSQPRLYNRTDKASYLVKETSEKKAFELVHKTFIGQSMQLAYQYEGSIDDKALAPHCICEIKYDSIHNNWYFKGTDEKHYILK